MFSARAQPQTAPISDAIYIEVIAALYSNTIPMPVACVCQAVVGTISYSQTGDALTALLTVISVTVAFARMLVVLAFRRQVRQRPLLDRSEAMVWEFWYAAGTFLTALFIGLFGARSLYVGDANCLVMAVGIAFGLGAGIVARVSMRPHIAYLGLCALGLPAILATFLKQWDVSHIAMGLMFLIFIAAGFKVVRVTYNLTLNQMNLKQKFEQLARIDTVTGLLNRSVLVTDLERMVADSGSGMAIHAMDLDHFKAANDRHGHPVGDALLKQVAERLMTLAGPSDLIVRMGGDEFILAQSSVKSRDYAEVMAQRIFESICKPYRVGGLEIVIGASIGIALSPEHGRTVEALLVRSDAALYRAKERRGTYMFATEPAPSQDRQHAA